MVFCFHTSVVLLEISSPLPLIHPVSGLFPREAIEPVSHRAKQTNSVAVRRNSWPFQKPASQQQWARLKRSRWRQRRETNCDSVCVPLSLKFAQRNRDSNNNNKRFVNQRDWRHATTTTVAMTLQRNYRNNNNLLTCPKPFSSVRIGLIATETDSEVKWSNRLQI